MPRIVAKGRQGGAFETLPAGSYDFIVTKAEQGVSKNNHPQVTLKTKVLNGPYADKSVTMWLSLHPNALFRVEEFLAATIPGEYNVVVLDEKDSDGNTLQELSFDPEALVDRSFSCDVTEGVNPSTGDKKNDFRKYAAYQDGSTPLSTPGADVPAGELAPGAAATDVAQPRTRQRQVAT